jgi:hypothetical protein
MLAFARERANPRWPESGSCVTLRRSARPPSASRWLAVTLSKYPPNYVQQLDQLERLAEERRVACATLGDRGLGHRTHHHERDALQLNRAGFPGGNFI